MIYSLQRMMARSQCLCFWIYLQHLTLLTMKFYFIVFTICLDLETLCYLGFNHIWRIVAVHGKHSNPAPLRYGVPQGSVLEPILFLYTQPLSNVIKHYPVFHQMYADDRSTNRADHLILWTQQHRTVHFKC